MHNSKAIIGEPITALKHKNTLKYKNVINIVIHKKNTFKQNSLKIFSKTDSLKILQIRLFKFILKSLLKEVEIVIKSKKNVKHKISR